jgi:hypothetical protein
VIFELEERLARLPGGPGPGARLGFACLECTGPVFLAFRPGSESPDYVIKVGPRADLERAHEVQSRLHERAPDLVARSLACEPLDDGAALHVQAGLRGAPWSYLSRSLASRADWDALRASALEGLRRLRGAILDVPAWRAPLRPGAALRAELERASRRDPRPSAQAARLVAEAAAALDRLGDLAAPWQHGDYCVNNLVLDGGRVQVVDFDELGGTSMPLHDHFGLALSIHALAAERGVGGALGDEVRACIAAEPEARALSKLALGGLYLHHLLWSADRCHGRPRRAPRLAMLMDLVERFAAAPEDYSATVR